MDRLAQIAGGRVERELLPDPLERHRPDLLEPHTVAAQSSFRNAKDFTGAVGKVDGAARELDKGKYADAVTKLGDFQKLLGQLAAADKPKLDPATAATLSAEAQGVIDCINAIETA